ncbi:DUF1559 family PulG-like putative transporter, partial [Singulisphaera rosea]
MSNITDGTSNTIAWAEMAHGKLEQFGCAADGGCDWETKGWWADADYSNCTITSFYPPNIKIPAIYYTSSRDTSFVAADGCDDGNSIPSMTSMSFHPGGVNAAFADGSVHFVKDSISSWNSRGITRSASGGANCVIPNTSIPGVWQALSTINGGEVISADSY